MFDASLGAEEAAASVEMKLLIHAAVIAAFFVGSDLALNHGAATRALNAKILQISKQFQREVARLVD